MAVNINKIITNNSILTGSSVDLVSSKNMTRNFGSAEDYVELYIEDPAGDNLYSIIPFMNYQTPGIYQPTDTYNIQELEFDPATDLQDLAISYGDYILTYNVLRPKIVKNYNLSFFIKEISADRTEIRLSTNNISNTDIETNTLDFIIEFQSVSYFKEFYINFGQGILLPAINVALDKNTNPYSILIKLLNPLPIQYDTNVLVSIVDKISNTQQFSADITLDSIPVTFPTLRGPNFDLDLDSVRVGPTPYYNFSQVTNFQGNFAPQLQQLLGQLSASNFAINIDYANFEYTDWIHYSSAARRLEGFKYKLSNIGLFTSASSSAAVSTTPTALLDAQGYQAKINSTIQSFDGYEQYLFYESGAYAWPKQNSTKPYINYSVTSSQAVNWYNGAFDSSSLYDDNNQNYLLYAMPGYIAENGDNELVFKFVASIGQMFDDIWIHIKSITDLYQAKNALDQGISKDIVYFALQSMGINVYTDQDGTDVFQYLYGVNSDGTYLPNTGSYQTLISASNYQTSGQDQQKGFYKRIYANLPLLLKSKGTTRFIQYLNTIFGIPDTIMSYVEYGGTDKITSSFEYEYDRFTYALKSSGSNSISIPWNYTSQSKARTGYNDIVPNGIEFRFKAYPTASNILATTFATQSLFYSGSDIQFNLLYRSTGSSNSIYSGSVGNFGYFQFKLGGLSVTSSTIPIYNTGSNSDSDNDTDWYSVLVQRTNPDLRIGDVSTSQTYTFYVKNNVWGEVGHVTTASLTTSTAATNSLWYTQGSIKLGGGTYPFSGSLQEIRLWSNTLNEVTFDSHVLNPESIEGNYTTSSYNDLTARFPLGNDLYIYNHTLTPSVNSVAPDQTIQTWTATFTNFLNQNNYSSFTETYYADVANSGYANPVTDKIRIYSGSEYGTQLLPNKSIQIPDLIPITKDIHLIDASLSPMDEIDRDIIAQLGSTYDLDSIIGNPNPSSYQEFEVLRNEYFKKYIDKYNYKDYVRLIEFFHNSLFRTLKDFTPARTNPATGILYRPHLLERSLAIQPEPYVTDFNNDTASINTAFISASNGGGYSQSIYPITYKTPVGNVTVQSDARDFFTGELPSSSIFIHDDFATLNYNPFTVFNPLNLSYYSESIWAYSYDALLNNVSSSVLSTIRQKISWQNSGSNPNLIEVLEPVELQDFTYKYLRHAKPRYIGSQTNSTEYNFYNNNDVDFEAIGSGPYGKNATIDRNSIQFAYFNEAVATGSQLIAMPERTNLYLKYLIDASGSLTELVQRDYIDVRNNQLWNLYQVQNIFKSRDIYNQTPTLNVSLFDNQKPSRQKNLDGNKEIYVSGIKYYPMLWRVANTDMIYSLDNGFSTSQFYDTSKWVVLNQNARRLIHYGWSETSFTGTPTWTLSSVPLPFDVIVTVRINYNRPFTASYNALTVNYFDINVTIPAKTASGANNFSNSFRIDVGGDRQPLLSMTVINVKPAAGVDPGFIYFETELSGSANLTVNSSDKRIVSCSAKQSKLYKAPIFFSGSNVTNIIGQGSVDSYINFISGSCFPVEYPFEINPGDIIRFDSGSVTFPTKNFLPANEYTILSVNVPTSASETNRVTFTLDKPVNDAVTSSAYTIQRYVFSKKITDETNIIINFKKNQGLTSGGIVKSNSLLLSIDDNVANIVSELKSKIFSTVLTT